MSMQKVMTKIIVTMTMYGDIDTNDINSYLVYISCVLYSSVCMWPLYTCTNRQMYRITCTIAFINHICITLIFYLY